MQPQGWTELLLDCRSSNTVASAAAFPRSLAGSWTASGDLRYKRPPMWHAGIAAAVLLPPLSHNGKNLMPFEMQLKDGEVKGGQNQKGEKLKACLVVLTKVSLISLKHTLLHVIPQTSPRLLPFPGIQTARIYLFPFPQRTSSLHNQFIHSSKSNVFQNIISHPSTLSTSTLNAFYPLPWFCIQGAILFLRHWITHSLTLSHVFKP